MVIRMVIHANAFRVSRTDLLLLTTATHHPIHEPFDGGWRLNGTETALFRIHFISQVKKNVVHQTLPVSRRPVLSLKKLQIETLHFCFSSKIVSMFTLSVSLGNNAYLTSTVFLTSGGK